MMRATRALIVLLLANVFNFSSGLAASKKSGKKGPKIVSGNGFAAPSQNVNLEDIVKKFPTRVPPNAGESDCPCGTGLLYKNCCQPFHTKDKLPDTPLDVLRSRYTAFCWRMIPYVMETTHPTCRDFRKDKVLWAKDLNRDGMFDSYDFVSLNAGEVEISQDNPSEGYIEFKVNLRANTNGSHLEGQEITVCERSKFLCDGNPPRWRYASGEVRSDVKGLEDVQLNK